MKLENTFTVPVTADTAWQVLLDVERIAPCMPGASLTGRDGDSFTGNVKVKLGPISLTYGGTATFASLDEANHVAVIEASGRETRGSGTAKAIITARLHEQGGVTEVAVETDLTITGKPAQFGRGVLAEVSGKLITAFADCLAAEITADGAGATEAAADPIAQPSPEPEPPAGASGPAAPEAIDLLATAGIPVLKRLAPVVLGLLVLAVIMSIRRRGR